MAFECEFHLCIARIWLSFSFCGTQSICNGSLRFGYEATFQQTVAVEILLHGSSPMSQNTWQERAFAFSLRFGGQIAEVTQGRINRRYNCDGVICTL